MNVMASYRELAGIVKAVLRAVQAGTMSAEGVLFQSASRLLAEAEAGKNRETSWTPFVKARARAPKPLTQAEIDRVMQATGRTREDVIAAREEVDADLEMYVNSRYQVMLRPSGGDMIHLSIKRIDQEPVRSWRDLQRIKNELVGPECEAVELYPAESRLVDSANQYHLFVLTNPAQRIPLGFDDGRLVTGEIQLGEGQEPLE
jgi:hypothetical protein